jgi:heme A synthase
LVLLFVAFTGRRWVEAEPQKLSDDGMFPLKNLGVLAIAAVYAQLFMGAAFRHGGMHFLPHIIGAVVTTAILLWASLRALVTFGAIRQIRGAAIAVLALLLVQIGLGFGAYLTRVEWGREAVQPMASMVWTTVAHVAVGALLLAHCFLLTVQAFRHTRVPALSAVSNEQKAVPA